MTVYGEGTPVIPNKYTLPTFAYEMFVKEGWDETKPAVIVAVVEDQFKPADFFYRIKMTNGEVQAVDKLHLVPVLLPKPAPTPKKELFSVRG